MTGICRYTTCTLLVYGFLSITIPLSHIKCLGSSVQSSITDSALDATFETTELLETADSSVKPLKASIFTYQDKSARRKQIMLIAAAILTVCFGIGAHLAYQRYTAYIEEKLRVDGERLKRIAQLQAEDVERDRLAKLEEAKVKKEEEEQEEGVEILPIDPQTVQYHQYLDELNVELKQWNKLFRPTITEEQFEKEMRDRVEPFMQLQHQALFDRGDEGLSPAEAKRVNAFRERVWKAYQRVIETPYNQHMIDTAKQLFAKARVQIILLLEAQSDNLSKFQIDEEKKHSFIVDEQVKASIEAESGNPEYEKGKFFIDHASRLVELLNHIFTLRDALYNGAREKYQIAMKPGAEVSEYLDDHPEEDITASLRRRRRKRPKMADSVNEKGESILLKPIQTKEEFMQIAHRMSYNECGVRVELLKFNAFYYHPFDHEAYQQSLSEEAKSLLSDVNVEKVTELLKIDDDKLERHQEKYDEYIRAVAKSYNVKLYDEAHEIFKKVHRFVIENVPDVGEDIINYNIDDHRYYYFNAKPVFKKIEALEKAGADRYATQTYYLFANNAKDLAEILSNYTAQRDALMEYIEKLDFDS